MWSDLYPGNRHTVHCLQPAVLATESALELAPERKKRIVWRLDAGAGTDEKLRWLLARGYHIIAKGYSNKRAKVLAKQVRRWYAYRDVWIAEVQPVGHYGRPVRVFVKRRLKEGKFRHSYYVSTLSLPSNRRYIACYDSRGAAEIEQFRNDKGGLHLVTRRKQRFLSQKGLILLADLAHNLLADFHHHALTETRFETYNLKRIVRDLLTTPGRLTFEDGQLKRIELLSRTQNAADLLFCLERYCVGE